MHEATLDFNTLTFLVTFHAYYYYNPDDVVTVQIFHAPSYELK